jgi:hypothetical protein
LSLLLQFEPPLVESIGAGSPTLVETSGKGLAEDAGAVAALDRLVMTAGTETDAGAIAALEDEKNCPSRRHSRSFNSGNDNKQCNILEQS